MRTWRRCEATAGRGALLGVLLGMMAGGAAAMVPGVDPSAGLEEALPKVSERVPAAMLDGGPLFFEPNVGQAAAEVRYLARGPGYRVFLNEHEAVWVLRAAAQPVEATAGGAGAERRARAGRERASASAAGAAVRMRLEGAGRNPAPQLSGEGRLAGVSHYYRGTDPAEWRHGVPHYARVHYAQVYPGIDLVYYGRPGALEYDFEVAAGADPGQIRLSFAGVDGIRVEEASGDLILAVEGMELRHRAPRLYQQAAGERRTVAGRYRLRAADGAGVSGLQVGFEVADYDPTLALVIDPVVVYSTYLGGGLFDDAYAVAVDTTGHAYIAGSTESMDFPTLSALQPTNAGSLDAFVTKLDPSGREVVYSTYVGGGGDDEPLAVAVDAAGHAHVAGVTDSLDFPTVNAIQATRRGSVDGFVLKLDLQGQRLLYSTYWGGGGDDLIRAIAVDGTGHAYVVGGTESPDFRTVEALQPAFGGDQDGFVTKLDPNGQGPVYSTYWGGSDGDSALAIAVDGSGHAYVGGRTESLDFPTVGAFQAALRGGGDGFVTKLDPQGRGPVYSTYLGGGSYDYVRAIGVDGVSNVYLAGQTESKDFPIVNAFDPHFTGDPPWDREGFAVKLDPSGGSLVYATYLGGRGDDGVEGLAIDGAGYAVLVGGTGSPDFPLVAPLQATLNGEYDAFVTKLDPTGRGIYSTYFGGSGGDGAVSVALDAAGNVYFAGFTISPDFPVRDAAYPRYGGGGDGFVAKLADGSRFADVPPDHWAAGYIAAIAEAGITTGCGGGNYCPGAVVTREQMAAFLVRALEGEPPAGYCGGASPFLDVSPGSWACGYIKRLVELGVTSGCGGGNYCPVAAVTREQMAAFLVRALQGEPPAGYCGGVAPFGDVAPGSWACGYIKRLAELGITTGCAAGLYCPLADVQRDQMAAFLARAFLGL